MRSRVLLVLTVLASGAALALPSSAAQGTYAAEYSAPGTLVVKQAGQPPAADTGVLVCSRSQQTLSVGGGCVSFGPGPDFASVVMLDAVMAHDVAFQVCIDNNHDGACVSPDRGPCADQIFFSHNDEGQFFNPLGPLPVKHKDGCPGGVWDGYVVFLCTGAHAAGTTHNHAATRGSILTRTGPGTGFGTFCGGSTQDPSNKSYVVQ